MFPKLVDVTNITGSKVVTKVTSWTTPNGDLLVEHLAGRAPNGDLMVFYWMPGQDWKVVNVSNITGQRISGPVTSWITPNGDLLVEHLAGRAPNGDLMVFYWMPGQDWKVVNVSNITGQRISGPVTSWITPNGDLLVEHLAGRAPNGDLMVFYWMPGQDWKVVNVSNITGQRISGPVTSWITPNGDLLVEHLAGRAPNGDLMVFYWMPGQDWKVVNVSNITGQRISGPVTSWITPNGDLLVEHLAGRAPNGDLMVFYWMPGRDWKAVNVTSITGLHVQGIAVPYQVNRDGRLEELLVVQGVDGHLYKLWWHGSRDWQAIDLTEALGIDVISTSPEAWISENHSRPIEHVAATTPNEHLVVTWYDSESRKLTDDKANDFHGLTSKRNQRRKLVVILWDYHRPGHPAPPRQQVEDTFISQTDSVKQFFNESSLGRFDFDVVEFLPPVEKESSGWYQAAHPSDFYRREGNFSPDSLPLDDPHRWVDVNGDFGPANRVLYLDDNGFVSGHAHKYAEAIWASSEDFAFSDYDKDNTGTLDPLELFVCVLVPQNGAAGFHRGGPLGQQVPKKLPLKSNGLNNGVILPESMEIYLGNPPHVGLIFHELSHQFLNAADMYHGWPPESEYVPFTAGSFSLMCIGMPANLDPFHRLKYGWLRHRIALRSGHYSLRAAVTHGEAIVLMDKEHSTEEYFLIENRWNANNTCDANLPDQGLAVWHIIEDSTIYNDSPAPPGTNTTYWNSTRNQWSRRGVRLIRPVISNPTNNNQGLWDGSDPATGYDLLSTDPNSQHSELRWAGTTTAGSPSGFMIRNISQAGPLIEFDIEVPS